MNSKGLRNCSIDDNSIYERGRIFKLKDLQNAYVCRLPDDKLLVAKHHVKLIYRDKLNTVRLSKQKEWISCHETNPYFDLPILSIVIRGITKKGVTDVLNGMVNVFQSNVLIVSDFKYCDFDRPPLKTLFKIHGIALIHEDEIVK